jgi:hypothetical protein
MTQTTESIVQEVLHLKAQYEAEIGKVGHKPWPKSIKERILKLCNQGMRPGKVSRLTGIPYHSILPWRREVGLVRAKSSQPKGNFHSLTVTDQVSHSFPTGSRTVTVKVRSFEIQLSHPREAAEFIMYFEKIRGGHHAL